MANKFRRIHFAMERIFAKTSFVVVLRYKIPMLFLRNYHYFNMEMFQKGNFIKQLSHKENLLRITNEYNGNNYELWMSVSHKLLIKLFISEFSFYLVCSLERNSRLWMNVCMHVPCTIHSGRRSRSNNKSSVSIIVQCIKSSARAKEGCEKWKGCGIFAI